MARIRSIKPTFFRSEDVSVLPLRARLTWIGLWTHCDDAGRAKDNARLIKGDVWPLDDVSLRDIEDDLVTLASYGRIVRYEVDGKRYLEVVNWRDHQAISKPTPSRLPGPGNGHILAAVEPPPDPYEDPDDDPEQFESIDSDNPPVGLPEPSRRTPVGKGREGKGEEGKGGETRARAREATHAPDDPTSEPPPIRCPDHIKTLDPPPCRACRTARELREAWDLERIAAASAAQSSNARAHAEAARAEIAACDQCDTQGRLIGGVLCRHDPTNAERTKRGAEAARATVGRAPKARDAMRTDDPVAEAQARVAARRAAHQAAKEAT